MLKALVVATEEVREELQIDQELFWDNIWKRIVREGIYDADDMSHMLEFRLRIEKELQSKNWSIYKFRNEKNETILNVFKKVLKQIVKEEKKELSNDVLSRILNVIRNCYGGPGGMMTAALYPPEAFLKRCHYDIPENLGDEDSCFRLGGYNEGSALWLIEEWKNYQRAWLIVFHYKSGNKKGVGRCWAYALSNAVYVTNFYSYKFEVKDDRFKKLIVRLVSRLFNLSENVRFIATGKNVQLPVYLNGDGIIIYEPLYWRNSNEVLSCMANLRSRCMWCNNEVKVKDLRRYDEPITFDGRMVNGLVICMNCSYSLDEREEEDG